MNPDQQQKSSSQGVQPGPITGSVSTPGIRERDGGQTAAGGLEVSPDLKKIGVKVNQDIEGVPPTSLGDQTQSNQGAVIPPATGILSEQKPVTEEPEVSEPVLLTEEQKKEALREKRGQIIPFGGGNKSEIYEATEIEKKELKELKRAA